MLNEQPKEYTQSVRLAIINHTYAREKYCVSKANIYWWRKWQAKESYNLDEKKRKAERRQRKKIKCIDEGNGIRAIRRNITFHYLNPKITEIKCFVCLIHGCVFFPMYFIELCHNRIILDWARCGKLLGVISVQNTLNASTHFPLHINFHRLSPYTPTFFIFDNRYIHTLMPYIHNVVS